MYNQQINAVKAQVPAIQKLYQTLTSGLQSQYDTNLASGVQSINEDASARGVLRSTLPNDARVSLTGQLGAALQQSLGQLGQQRASDIANINQQLGQLRIGKVNDINSLANALAQTDYNNRELAVRRQELAQRQAEARAAAAAAAARSSGGGYSSGGKLSLGEAESAVRSSFTTGTDGYVNPKEWNQYLAQWNARGLSTSSFVKAFKNYANPWHYKSKSNANKYGAYQGIKVG